MFGKVSDLRHLLLSAYAPGLFLALASSVTSLAHAQPAPNPATFQSAQCPSQVPPMPAVSYPSLQTSRNETTTRRARDGHFYFETVVNGGSVQMLFDTGASQISLRAEDAAKMSLGPGALTYSKTVNTSRPDK